jgi:hypothetical protein
MLGTDAAQERGDLLILLSLLLGLTVLLGICPRILVAQLAPRFGLCLAIPLGFASVDLGLDRPLELLLGELALLRRLKLLGSLLLRLIGLRAYTVE